MNSYTGFLSIICFFSTFASLVALEDVQTFTEGDLKKIAFAEALDQEEREAMDRLKLIEDTRDNYQEMLGLAELPAQPSSTRLSKVESNVLAQLESSQKKQAPTPTRRRGGKYSGTLRRRNIGGAARRRGPRGPGGPGRPVPTRFPRPSIRRRRGAPVTGG